jgi:hypothetical protein
MAESCLQDDIAWTENEHVRQETRDVSARWCGGADGSSPSEGFWIISCSEYCLLVVSDEIFRVGIDLSVHGGPPRGSFSFDSSFRAARRLRTARCVGR